MHHQPNSLYTEYDNAHHFLACGEIQSSLCLVTVAKKARHRSNLDHHVAFTANHYTTSITN